MPAKLSTHVLDLTRGAPAAGMTIELWRLNAGAAALVKTVRTNADGRTDAPLLAGAELLAGEYKLVFRVRDYFAAGGVTSVFFPVAEIAFQIDDAAGSYHVPLLVTPHAFSTYRGS